MKVEYTTWINDYGQKCFMPSDLLEIEELVDISTMGDTWASFINPHTGEKHSCEKYYNDNLKEVFHR